MNDQNLENDVIADSFSSLRKDLENVPDTEQHKIKIISNRLVHNHDIYPEKLYKEINYKDVFNKYRLIPLGHNVRIPYESILPNVHKVYNMPIRREYDSKSFNPEKEVKNAIELQKEDDIDPSKDMSIVLHYNADDVQNIESRDGNKIIIHGRTDPKNEINVGNIAITLPEQYSAIKKFDMYSKHFYENKNITEEPKRDEPKKNKIKYKPNKIQKLRRHYSWKAPIAKSGDINENNTLDQNERIEALNFEIDIGRVRRNQSDKKKSRDGGDVNESRKRRSVIKRERQKQLLEKMYSKISFRRITPQEKSESYSKAASALARLEHEFKQKIGRRFEDINPKNRISNIVNYPELNSPEDYHEDRIQRTTLHPCCPQPPPPTPPEEPAYLNMTGDHMNIYPEAPEWSYPEVLLNMPNNRPWWYYNQDDYRPFKPAVPRYVNRI